MTIKLQSWKEFRYEFENKPVYTRKQVVEMLEKQKKELTVSRVIRCPSGRIDDEREALKILHIHQTELGLMVLVK